MIYKYCKIDGFDILLQSRLKTTKIDDFNDPFELIFGVDKDSALDNVKRDFEENPKLIKIWKDILSVKKIQFDPKSPEDFMKKVKDYLIGDFAQAIEGMNKHWNNTTGLICMSKKPDIIQMWAHYTDNHRGIVVGIEESEFVKDKRELVPVDYKDEMVLFPITTNPKKFNQYEKYFLEILHRKESKWGYEKELRIYTELDEKKDDYSIIPTSSIKEIYLGLKSNETTEIIAISIKQRNEYKHLKIYKMGKHNSAYKLVPKEL